MTNRDRNPSTCSSASEGRCAMSIFLFPFRDDRYMTSRAAPAIRADAGQTWLTLLAVELDDELFLDLGVDLGPDRQRVHKHAHLLRHDLKPGRNLTLADLGTRHDERGHLKGLGGDLDDVVLAHPVR